MIQPASKLIVADNSGAKLISVIRVIGGSPPSNASLGDVVIASVKEAIPRASAKKKDVVRAVIVRTKKPVRRKDGTAVRFDDNAAVLIDGAGILRATRIFGPVAREVREKGFTKIASVAQEVI